MGRSEGDGIAASLCDARGGHLSLSCPLLFRHLSGRPRHRRHSGDSRATSMAVLAATAGALISRSSQCWVSVQGPALPVGCGNSSADHSDQAAADRKSTRLNSSHLVISYAVFCLKKKNNNYM